MPEVMTTIKEVLRVLIENIFLIISVWWWLILPILAYYPARKLYQWYIYWEVWYKEDVKWAMFEITPPAEIKKPFRAMEDVYGALYWSLYDSPNWRERWCEGELPNGPFWGSFEVVSVGGDIKFYLRIQKGMQEGFEAVLHSHYPELEIKETRDYTEDLPQDILERKDWDMYGEDYVFFQKDMYPIRTYKYFEIKPEAVDEEERVDTFTSLMEAMAKLKRGEIFWFQMTLNSVTNSDVPWIDEGKAEIHKLANRDEPEKFSSITGEAARFMIHKDYEPFAKKEKEQEFIPAEMKLTPGEREVLQAVEEKVSKHGFRTTIRSLYFAEKDVFFSPNGKIARAYFSHFSSNSLNNIRFLGSTRTKIHYFFRNRRLYTRKKKILRRYIKRFPPMYPDRKARTGIMILTPEELATVFHFPSMASVLPPGVPRGSAKRGVPPSSIPIGELPSELSNQEE